MLFNKNIIKEKELSIHIHSGGFCFFTSYSQFFFDHTFTQIKKNSSFEKILEENELLNFERVNCIHFERPATFVPITLYDSSKKESYLKQNVRIDSNLKIIEDTTSNQEIKILYQASTTEEELFKKLYDNLTLTHYTKVLYEYIFKGVKSGNGVVIYIHLRDNFFDVMVFDGKNLLFYNTYSHKNEDEFLYYSMAVAEEYIPNKGKLPIIFLGKFNRYNSYYKALEMFLEKLEFTEEKNEIAINKDNFPAPFFINIFD